MFFSVYTLGCKLNQLETEAITDAFIKNDFKLLSANNSPDTSAIAAGSAGSLEPVGSTEPGIVIVNTCTVTSMAEQKARRLIRKLLKDYPVACLIVTGCYAQLDRELIEKEFPERVIVIPGEDKARLLDLPAFLAEAIKAAQHGAVASQTSSDKTFIEMLLPLISSWLSSSSVSPRLSESSSKVDPSFRFKPEKFYSHSRSFIKIQDGCDRRCSYCRVCLARGKSKSLGSDEVLSEIKSLEERGFNEAVLTGVNITQYMDADRDLAGLLEILLTGTKKIRIRLSSIDPDKLSDKFFDVITDNRIRPHFHLALQSGSAAILAKMGRAYTPEVIDRTVERLRIVKKDPFLACDIIAAFPGETEEEFEETKTLCGKTGFSWIHVFPFSPRPGTAAFNFPGRIPERVAKTRVELLSGLGQKGRGEYIERWKGREVEAIVEAGTRQGREKSFISGVSENYLKLQIGYADVSAKVKAPVPGSLIRCRILKEEPKNPRFDAFAALIL